MLRPEVPPDPAPLLWVSLHSRSSAWPDLCLVGPGHPRPAVPLQRHREKGSQNITVAPGSCQVTGPCRGLSKPVSWLLTAPAPRVALRTETRGQTVTQLGGTHAPGPPSTQVLLCLSVIERSETSVHSLLIWKGEQCQHLPRQVPERTRGTACASAHDSARNRSII